jgi:hypothetical protein
VTGPTPWIAFLLTLAVVLFGLVPLWWIRRGHPRIGAEPVGFSVTPVGSTRGGDVVYREGEHELRFGWDLSASGASMAFIHVPGEERWPELVPWAIGRREDILERVAREMKRQRCPSCRVEIGPKGIEFFER